MSRYTDSITRSAIKAGAWVCQCELPEPIRIEGTVTKCRICGYCIDPDGGPVKLGPFEIHKGTVETAFAEAQEFGRAVVYIDYDRDADTYRVTQINPTEVVILTKACGHQHPLSGPDPHIDCTWARP